jgi:tetratricopeptide (TPR) repeat protein
MEELRRRVQADPASIAFAALAEEYRRAGRYDEAIDACRVGLQRHPSYLSARVTLGRALIETGDYATAREELELVLRSAPENLAAIRAMAEIHERTGRAEAHEEPAPAIPIRRETAAPPPAAAVALDWTLPAAQPPAAAPVVRPAAPSRPAVPETPAVIARLERFLTAIQTARRSVSSN